MKYKKGTFVIVPNLDILANKPTELQTLFMWICIYADDEGTCFPSRSALSKKCGVTVKTIDKYLTKLIELGIVEKTTRKKKNSKENTSNLYQICVPETLPSVTKDTTPSHPNDPVTIPSINYTNLTTIPPKVEATVKEVKEYNYKEEVDKLLNSNWKVNKIIALYFLKKRFNFENQVQFNSEYKRNLRPAKELEGYNSTQIEQTMNYLEDKGLTWTLNAIGRNISNVVNKK